MYRLVYSNECNAIPMTNNGTNVHLHAWALSPSCLVVYGIKISGGSSKLCLMLHGWKKFAAPTKIRQTLMRTLMLRVSCSHGHSVHLSPEDEYQDERMLQQARGRRCVLMSLTSGLGRTESPGSWWSSPTAASSRSSKGGLVLRGQHRVRVGREQVLWGIRGKHRVRLMREQMLQTQPWVRVGREQVCGVQGSTKETPKQQDVVVDGAQMCFDSPHTHQMHRDLNAAWNL